MSKKNMIKSILIIAFSVIFGNIMLTFNVFADGGGSAGGDSGGGTESSKETCLKSLQQRPSGQYAQYNKCGAAFQLFDVNDKNGWPEYASDKTYIENTVVPACKAVSADKFYFLALARATWYGDTISYKGTIGNRRYVHDLSSSLEGGSGTIPYIAKAGLDFSEVLKTHKYVTDYANKHPELDFSEFLATPWADLTYFCWSEGWTSTSTTSTFGAWSTAVAKDSNGTTKLTVNTKSIDSNNSGTVKTKEDVIYVDFKHRFNYEKPTSGSGKFDPATTYYGVKVSGAVDKTIVESGTKYTVSSENSGPDRPIGPLEPNTVGDSTQTINVPETGSVKVCSKISYDPKVIGWKSKQSGGYEMDPETTQNMSKSSEVCITVERLEGDEEELEDGGQLNFYSTSTVKIAAQNGDVNSHEETSNSNEMVTAKLSTKGEKLIVGFSHDIHTEHTGVSGESNPEKDVLVDPVCTTYSVLQSSPNLNSLKKTVADMVEHCVSGVGHSSWASTKKTVSTTDNVEIKLNPGDTITVCQRIDYAPATVYLKRLRQDKLEFDDYYRIFKYDPEEMKEFYYYDAEHNLRGIPFAWLVDAGGESLDEDEAAYVIIDDELIPAYYARYVWVFDYWEYFTSGEEDGSGYSGACVEVTRPLEPSTSDNPGGTSDASPGSDPMYTGEQSTMKWSASAIGYASHRIMKAQAVAYQVKVDKKIETDEDRKISKGSNPSSILPCSWYEGKISPDMLRYRCTVIKEENYNPDGFYGDPSAEYNFGEETQFIVTNNVGDKHCNAFGIQWEYWYGVVRWTGTTPPGNIISEEWTSEGKSYWTIYDAICKPILKKPSTSIWNGGLMTNGNVKTSLSNRYTGDNLGFANTNLQSTRLKFGSWTEYLAVVGNEVINSPFGFSSGAALGNGSSAADLLANSPLTIANTGNQDNKIGNSGINSNSTYRARLSSYLLKNINPSTEEEINSLQTQNVTDTKILYYKGDNLNITQNITVKDANYATIYQLPQIVIYATGNINIGSNVEQIDAWLISGGTVDTCSNFANGSTEAQVKEYNDGNGGSLPQPDCSKQLTINGPIIAKSVTPNRSAGADPITYGADRRVSDEPRAASGEVFNLSADTYLWAYAQAGRYGSSYSEAYTRELPPRY